jgi:ribosomal protein S27E
MSTIQPQSYFQSVRQFRCTNCAGEITLINKRTNYVGCQYCGAVLDATSEAHQVITKLHAPSGFPPKSFIRLGMKAIFHGKKHQVLGRTRWQSDYKEYWSEEGETGYSDERWEYDEWVLMSEDRTYFYLIEDADGYAISTSFLPQHPNLPTGTNILNFHTAKKERVIEYGDSNVLYFEGESTYQIKAGDRVKFAEYTSSGKSYIAEWRLLDTSKEIKEIEFFEEVSIPEWEVLAAFEDNAVIQEAKQKIGQANKRKRFWRITYWLTALIFAILLIHSFTQGKEIYSQQFAVPQTTQPATEEDDPKVLATTQPIPMQAIKKIYQLELSATIPDNTDLWTGLEILDEQGQVVNVMEGDFFRASGDEAWQEDGESGVEHWEEAELSKSLLYRLDQPGTYTARILALPTTVPDATVKLTLVEGSILSRYYTIGLIIFTLIALVNSVSASMAKQVNQHIRSLS